MKILILLLNMFFLISNASSKNIFPYSCEGFQLESIEYNRSSPEQLKENDKSFFEIRNGGKNQEGEQLTAWGYLVLEGKTFSFDFFDFQLVKIIKQNVYLREEKNNSWVTIKDYVYYYLFEPDKKETIEKIIVAVPASTSSNNNENLTAITEIYLKDLSQPVLFTSSCQTTALF